MWDELSRKDRDEYKRMMLALSLIHISDRAKKFLNTFTFESVKRDI